MGAGRRRVRHGRRGRVRRGPEDGSAAVEGESGRGVDLGVTGEPCRGGGRPGARPGAARPCGQFGALVRVAGRQVHRTAAAQGRGPGRGAGPDRHRHRLRSERASRCCRRTVPLLPPRALTPTVRIREPPTPRRRPCVPRTRRRATHAHAARRPSGPRPPGPPTHHRPQWTRSAPP